MKQNIYSIEAYINELPEERKVVIAKLRNIFLNSLPLGFDEVFQYGMISYVVPLSRYPKGYLNREGEPLPFLSLGSLKNHIAIYHMGLYASETFLNWAKETYLNDVGHKLDMGKSCLRFKNIDNIPYGFIEQLAKMMSVDEFIKQVESNTR